MRGLNKDRLKVLAQRNATSLDVPGYQLRGFQNGTTQHAICDGSMLFPCNRDIRAGMDGDQGPHDVSPSAIHHLLNHSISRQPVKRDVKLELRHGNLRRRRMFSHLTLTGDKHASQEFALLFTRTMICNTLGRKSRCARLQRSARLK